eukprot:TRINITY_DN8746_c0_g2_i4.p1 TRINITY_DN8746_c0_g2~~TRINITY_DN8746_c0_g2_i4.p1  ORF type:complete len:540 (+),score=106.62 TRINITY_DN8746_c0_g2_i4:134-1753(+)
MSAAPSQEFKKPRKKKVPKPARVEYVTEQQETPKVEEVHDAVDASDDESEPDLSNVSPVDAFRARRPKSVSFVEEEKRNKDHSDHDNGKDKKEKKDKRRKRLDEERQEESGDDEHNFFRYLLNALGIIGAFFEDVYDVFTGKWNAEDNDPNAKREEPLPRKSLKEKTQDSVFWFTGVGDAPGSAFVIYFACVIATLIIGSGKLYMTWGDDVPAHIHLQQRDLVTREATCAGRLADQPQVRTCFNAAIARAQELGRKKKWQHEKVHRVGDEAPRYVFHHDDDIHGKHDACLTHFWSYAESPSVKFQLLADAQVIVEIGGNKGDDLMEYAKRFPHSQIFSFEPTPLYYSRLADKFDGVANVTVSNIGAADSDQLATFLVHEHKSHHEDLHTDRGGSCRTHVCLRDVDALLTDVEEATGRVPDVLILNCEGCEYRVLHRLAHQGWMKHLRYLQVAWHEPKGIAKHKRVEDRCALEQWLEKTWDPVWAAGSGWQGWQRRVEPPLSRWESRNWWLKRLLGVSLVFWFLIIGLLVYYQYVMEEYG